MLSRLAQTSANWLHTCNRSGIMQPMPTWAAGSSRPRVTGRSGGPAACARLGGRTGGRPQSTTVPMAAAAPTRLAEQSAIVMTSLTITKRWQRSGTGRPMGKGHQRMWQHSAIPKQPGGVPSVDTDGAPVWATEPIFEELDAPSVPVRPAASSQASPASPVDQHTCWLSGTGRPMIHMAGTQTRSLWAQ